MDEFGQITFFTVTIFLVWDHAKEKQNKKRKQ